MATPSITLPEGSSIPTIGFGVWQTPAGDTERAATGAPDAGQIRRHVQLGNIVIPKSVNPSRIVSNFDVFGVELDEQDMASIGSLDDGTRRGRDPRTFNFTG